jgi:hypothetical protein
MARLVCTQAGIATLVSSVEKDAMAAKGLLRHASVTTTQKHFIKEIPEITLRAMEKVGMLFNKCSTVGTAKPIKMRRVRKSYGAVGNTLERELSLTV